MQHTIGQLHAVKGLVESVSSSNWTERQLALFNSSKIYSNLQSLPINVWLANSGSFPKMVDFFSKQIQKIHRMDKQKLDNVKTLSLSFQKSAIFLKCLSKKT